MAANRIKESRKRSRVAVKSGSSQPTRLQVGALCWRLSSKGNLKILLITSRDTGRWVIPKGWTMRKRTTAEAAEREAWEEAGVRGAISRHSVGIFTYDKRIDRKRSIPCVVKVFPMKVHEQLKHYPEYGQRKSRWFSAKKAARRVQEPELRAIIRNAEDLIKRTEALGPAVT